jgi:hypothetical protein
MSPNDALEHFDADDEEPIDIEQMMRSNDVAKRYFQMYPDREAVCRAVVRRESASRPPADGVSEAGSVREQFVALTSKIEELNRKLLEDKRALTERLDKAEQVSRELRASIEQIKKGTKWLDEAIAKLKKESKISRTHLDEIDCALDAVNADINAIASELPPVGAIVAATKNSKALDGSSWLPADGREVPDDSAIALALVGNTDAVVEHAERHLPNVGMTFLALETLGIEARVPKDVVQCGNGLSSFVPNLALANGSTAATDSKSVASPRPISDNYGFFIKYKQARLREIGRAREGTEDCHQSHEERDDCHR